jgi:beta-lactam-binding protein with PASTA domain
VGSGSNVGILVSSGPPSGLTAPSLVGSATADPAKTISDAGFEPVVITVPAAAGQAPGAVVAQYPQAGAPYSSGFPVIVMVAGPATP